MKIYNNIKDQIVRHNNFNDSKYLNQNYENNLNQNQNIFELINEHKRKLNEIKNMESLFEKDRHSAINQKRNDISKDDISHSIQMAKDYLKYNKSRTDKIFSNIDNSINNNKIINNSFNSNYLNYDIKNDFNYKTQYNYKTIPYKTYYSNTYNNIEDNGKDMQYLSTKKNSFGFMNTDSNFRVNNYGFEGRNYNNSNYNEEDNILIASNIKLLKHKLENKESKIQTLESNISYLNNENHNLKQYIKKLETNLQTISSNNRNSINLNNNNTNDLNEKSGNEINIDKNNDFNNLGNEEEIKSTQIPSLMNKENTNTINDNGIIFNIQKIMSSINFFIRKMYQLFNNIYDIKENYIDLNYNQHFELQKHLVKLEKIINKFVTQNTNPIKLDIEKKIPSIINRKENEDNFNSFYSEINFEPRPKKKNKIKVYKKNKSANKNITIKKKKNKEAKSINNNIYRRKSDKKISFTKKNSKSKTKQKIN